MTLILLGLLISMVVLLWMLVLAIVQEDRQSGKQTVQKTSMTGSESRHPEKTAA
jgi:hypothetical protein